MALQTRKPTGRPSWPVLLLSGEGGTGKSYRAAEFTGDPRIGRSLWLELGETTSDEYGSVPGADYEIIEHDGTWPSIMAQLEAARDEARKVAAQGGKPMSLTVDTVSSEWAMLSEWADRRARRMDKNAALLRKNPDAEVTVTPNLWNDATSRHRKFMTQLLMFPGIVVLIAREKLVMAMDKAGNPVSGPKEWRLEAQKTLEFDVTGWVRLTRSEAPAVVKLRTLNEQFRVMPGEDDAKPWKEFTLAGLVFDVLGCGEGTAQREVTQLNADQVMPDEQVPAEDAAEKPSGVQRPGRPVDVAKLAATGVDHMVKAATVEAATTLWEHAKKSPARDVEVSGLLSQDDRDTLGVAEGQQVSLLALSEMVGKYVSQFRRAVRDAGQPPADHTVNGQRVAA